MSAATVATGESSTSPREVAWIWARHLTSLLLPLNALVFLWTGPHTWYIAPLFLIPIGYAYAIDGAERAERRQPVADLPAWPFDALVYALAGLQFWTVYELARVFAVQSLFSVDMLLVFVVVGASSGFSIITAHELIHRKTKWEQQLGRLLLCTVLNEHFYTEHLRGHHVRVGTPEDPATARFGETYNAFYRRTIPGQFASGWALEAKRLGNPGWLDGRMLGNRILQGLAVGWGLALLIGWLAGPVALLAFLLQAFSASRLLEAVNYFEHWGLTRGGHRVSPKDSWDTHAWFTYYGLIGLSRHADHHAEPARPFQQLRVMNEAPILPGGYVRMVDLTIDKNDEFRALATEELQRCQLGPFENASQDEVAELAAAGVASPGPSGPRSAWLRAPSVLRRVLVVAGLLLAVTLGAQWEMAGAMSTGARLGLNLWIAAAFAAALFTHARLANRIEHEGLCWAAAFAVLIGLGRLSELLVA